MNAATSFRRRRERHPDVKACRQVVMSERYKNQIRVERIMNLCAVFPTPPSAPAPSPKSNANKLINLPNEHIQAMKYSNSALAVFASLAVTSVSAQLMPPASAAAPQQISTMGASAPVANTFDDSDKCPGPRRNDKGCRCISVEDYDDLRGAIERMDDNECKCFEAFSVQKQPHEPEISIDDARKLEIRCKEVGQCEITGPGTHLTIEGELASATLSGFRFIGATESAVIIKDGTGTGRKETREQVFCDTEFVNNENTWSDGGAIKVGTGAKIYVGNSYFESNTAARMGGAISGNASILQVLDSSFKANAAKLGGAIATNQPEAQLVLGGCDFDSNAAMMGPKYGPAVAANGLVEDLGENEAQPEDLMCLDCELTAGIRIREPQPQAQPVQDFTTTLPPPLPQQEDSTNALSNNQMQLPGAAPLDTAGMGVLLPTGDEGAASMVVVEEDPEEIIETPSITELETDDTEEASEAEEHTEDTMEEQEADLDSTGVVEEVTEEIIETPSIAELDAEEASEVEEPTEEIVEEQDAALDSTGDKVENTEETKEEQGAEDATATVTTFDQKCVQCTNVPTQYMIDTSKSCATYTYAFERRCGTEYGWWGRDGNPEHCQYSCWLNGAPHATQGDMPCCERADADDEILLDEDENEEAAEAAAPEENDEEETEETDGVDDVAETTAADAVLGEDGNEEVADTATTEEDDLENEEKAEEDAGP